jgi:hypothetical protein
MPPRENVENPELVSAQAGALHSPSRSLRSSHKKKEESLDVATTKAPWLEEGSAANEQSHGTQRTVKLDSKSDFQSALRAAASDDDPDGFEGDGTRAARAMIQAFGGLQVGSKRYLTAPNRALSTIREATGNEDTEDAEGQVVDDDSRFETSTSDTVLTGAEEGRDDSVLSTMKKAVKQFRVPNRGKQSTAVADSHDNPATKSPIHKESTPRTDDEIETAGTAFLDVIGKSLGLRYVVIRWNIIGSACSLTSCQLDKGTCGWGKASSWIPAP